MNTNHLFLFTISPVQSFISQARKTQDLYAGSQLLSDLCETAIDKITKNKGTIIFPATSNDSIPNRFIATFKNKNEDEMKKIGEDAEETVKAEFANIALTIFNEKCNGKTKPANFDEQIKQFFQTYWVALQYDDYQTGYKKIESFLGAVKNVRQFSQLGNGKGEIGRKCSLCGERNVLFCKQGSKNKLQLKPVWNNLTVEEKKLVNDFNDSITQIHASFELTEGLCAVCFTKRFYNKSEFPSTAEIALMNIIYKADLDNFGNGKKRYDPQLFYDENLTDKSFIKNGINAKAEDVTKTRDTILKEKHFKASELPKYYAIIAFDGDSMGKWLSGEYLNDKTQLQSFHKALSEKLGEYAKNAQEYLDFNLDKERRGKTVYAGGDDFIGFVNLNHLFDVMKNLREKFDETVNDNLKSYFTENHNMSFSAGVAIAHYKIPLCVVLDWARKMEKVAKDIDDSKNAFAVAVLKHSGEIEKTVYKWQYGELWTTDIINCIVYKLITDQFSNKFIKNLQLEFSRLTDENGKPRFLPEMLECELKRLLRRSCNEPKKGRTQEQYDKETGIQKLTKDLMLIYNAQDKYSSFSNFMSLLSISDFIARHTKTQATNND